MFNRINSFITINNIINKCQFELRQKRGTCDAITRLLNETHDENLKES